MMSSVAKLILTATSLAPILLAYAIIEIASPNGNYFYFGCWVISAIVLVGVCYLILFFAKNTLSNSPIHIVSVESTDKQMLAYIVSYLLPIIAQDTMSFRTNIYIASFILLMLMLCVYHSNAFHFNPVLALFGYHFYEVKTKSGINYLYITKRVIRNSDFEANVLEFSDYFYLETEVVKENIV